MADGRQFTEYRSVWHLLPPMPDGPWGGWVQRNAVIQAASAQRASDRSLTVLRGGQYRCVDTMVPETQKRIYSWNGPVVAAGAWAGGIGTGRSYLPGRPDLAGGDPDVLAISTFPDMPGTFDANPRAYASGPLLNSLPVDVPMKGAMRNRYSLPYGNN